MPAALGLDGSSVGQRCCGGCRPPLCPRLPSGIFSFPDRWSLAAVGQGLGRRITMEGREGQISQGRYRFLQPFESLGCLFYSQLSTSLSAGKASDSCLFRAVQEKASWGYARDRRMAVLCPCIVGLKKEATVVCCRRKGRGRKTYGGERRNVSVPSLNPPKKLEWPLTLWKLLWISAVPSQNKHPEIPRSCNIPLGVVALPWCLLTSCLPATTLNWVLLAQNLNKCMVLLAPSSRGCQHRKIMCIDLHV